MASSFESPSPSSSLSSPSSSSSSSSPSGQFGQVESPEQLGRLARTLLVEANALIRAPEARARFGVSGAGVTAAILDTGCNKEHQDFAKDRVLATFSAIPSESADDGNGHGSNVTGIVGANGVHHGIAPGCRLVIVKVLSNSGSGSLENLVRGLEWVVAKAEKYNIRCVSMSLGWRVNLQHQAEDNTVLPAIAGLLATLVANCIVPLIAAGNDFFKYQTQGMGTPAIWSDCVSVGAVYDSFGGVYYYEDGAVAKNTVPDQITPFSQRLHPSAGGASCTTVFAPGAPIVSTGIGGVDTSSRQSGTSQATPVVTGVVLLLQELFWRHQQRYPSVQEIKKWLQQGITIRDVDRNNDNVVHDNLDYPRVDAVIALTALLTSLSTSVPSEAFLSDAPPKVCYGVCHKSMMRQGFFAIRSSEGVYSCAASPRQMEHLVELVPLNLEEHIGQLIYVSFSERLGRILYGARLVTPHFAPVQPQLELPSALPLDLKVNFITNLTRGEPGFDTNWFGEIQAALPGEQIQFYDASTMTTALSTQLKTQTSVTFIVQHSLNFEGSVFPQLHLRHPERWISFQEILGPTNFVFVFACNGMDLAPRLTAKLALPTTVRNNLSAALRFYPGKMAVCVPGEKLLFNSVFNVLSLLATESFWTIEGDQIPSLSENQMVLIDGTSHFA